MLLSNALLVLSSLLFEVEAGLSRRYAKYDRRGLNSFPRAASLRSRHSTSSFLTNATKPFAVNGSALPDVHFDIGESYAGLLPIDDTSDRELFFWFVPSTNPAASDEIMIWLNGGPGCSSLDGFLHENGPVIWQSGNISACSQHVDMGELDKRGLGRAASRDWLFARYIECDK
jgi:hypothetical protein